MHASGTLPAAWVAHTCACMPYAHPVERSPLPPLKGADDCRVKADGVPEQDAPEDVVAVRPAGDLVVCLAWVRGERVRVRG